MTIVSATVAEMIQDARREGWADGFAAGSERGYRGGYELCLERLEQIARTEHSIIATKLRMFIVALRRSGSHAAEDG